MYREEIFRRLRELDEEASLLFPDTDRLHIIIVGGSALVLMELIPRGTHDIDALEASQKLQGIIEKYDINTRVKTYINNFPYNYEDRIQPLDFRGKVIDFYTASLEDIIIAKLYSFRDSDYTDITDPVLLKEVDWEKLHYLAFSEEEAKLSALNDRIYREFLERFIEYERRYRP